MHSGGTIDEVHAYLPWVAAHRAILNIILGVAPAGIDGDRDAFAAIRTDYVGRAIRRAIAQWELLVDIEIIIVHFQ